MATIASMDRPSSGRSRSRGGTSGPGGASQRWRTTVRRGRGACGRGRTGSRRPTTSRPASAALRAQRRGRRAHPVVLPVEAVEDLGLGRGRRRGDMSLVPVRRSPPPGPLATSGFAGTRRRREHPPRPSRRGARRDRAASSLASARYSSRPAAAPARAGRGARSGSAIGVPRTSRSRAGAGPRRTGRRPPGAGAARRPTAR